MFKVHYHKTNLMYIKEKLPQYYIVEREHNFQTSYLVYKHWCSIIPLCVIETFNSMTYAHIEGAKTKRIIAYKDSQEIIEIAQKLDMVLIILPK